MANFITDFLENRGWLKLVQYNSTTSGLEVAGAAISISGSAGADGKTVLSGTAAPTTEGVNGDFYIRTTTNFIYGPKAGGVWPAGVSMIGSSGSAGNSVLYGTAAPTTEGVDGNFYIRTTTSFLYGPKASGTWPAGTSMIGTMPSNAVVVDAVTGLFKTQAGASIAEASVATMADLILLTGATYDDTSILVKNPANNVSNYFPAKAFRMNSRWYLENGQALLYANGPRLRVTWPAAVWNNGGLTRAVSGLGAGHTKLTGTLGHALTIANQITPGDTYVYISGSVAATGSVDWPVGWIKLTAITDAGNDLTVLYPYSASLKEPVITEIGAGILSAVEVARIAIPPLSTQGGYEVLLGVKNFVITTEHRTKIWACATGTTLATLYGQAAPITGLLNNVNDATAAPIGTRAGLQNAGATNVNASVGAYVSTTGMGLGTGAVGYAVPALQTNVGTELVITFESSNGVDITMELVALTVNWRY